MPVTLSGYRVKAPINVSGRHNGVNVGILVSRLRDLGLRPGQFIVMCSWAKKFAFCNCLGSQVKCWGGGGGVRLGRC